MANVLAQVKFCQPVQGDVDDNLTEEEIEEKIAREFSDGRGLDPEEIEVEIISIER